MESLGLLRLPLDLQLVHSMNRTARNGWRRRPCPSRLLRWLLVVSVCWTAWCANEADSGEPSIGAADADAAARGYQAILSISFVPPYFDRETFDAVWREWPEPLRTRAAKATRAERTKLAFARYGLTRRPNDTSDHPLQFVVDEAGNWSPNCFTCHGGQLQGKPFPGLPNNRYALRTMIEETRAAKTHLGKPWSSVDWGLSLIELGRTNGRTNAVIFGVALGDRRTKHLEVVPPRRIPRFTHHDMDAPPLWYFYKKRRLYLDGFAEKDHRPLMQFTLDVSNDGAKVRKWEPVFRDIAAYLESLRPPPYPFSLDRKLAKQGETIFNDHCARCHGTYGEDWEYQEQVVPIDELKTDPLRLAALTVSRREDYSRNWLSYYGKRETVTDPVGYVAPPLDGIWASAPYFHNGSVPTLWHVLHPQQRPAVWRARFESYNTAQVGLRFESVERIPDGIDDRWERRWYFDTRLPGNSGTGHDFPDELSAAERDAVLEYLKTL